MTSFFYVVSIAFHTSVPALRKCMNTSRKKNILFAESAATRAPGRGESVTELLPFMNFPVHSYTCCSDRHASPYWTFICRWVSPLHCLKNRWQTLFFCGACCKWGRHLYTTTAPSCCIPASYCHLSVTLQTMSIIVVNLQDNRAVFGIFIALLRFSFDSPSYIFIQTALPTLEHRSDTATCIHTTELQSDRMNMVINSLNIRSQTVLCNAV